MSRAEYADWAVADLYALPDGCLVHLFRVGRCTKVGKHLLGPIFRRDGRLIRKRLTPNDAVNVGICGVFLPDGVKWRPERRPVFETKREVAA